MNTQTREEKGRAIYERGGIERINDTFFVPSEAGDGRYPVTLGAVGEHCGCGDHVHRNQVCKHIIAARLQAEADRDLINTIH